MIETESSYPHTLQGLMYPHLCQMAGVSRCGHTLYSHWMQISTQRVMARRCPNTLTCRFIGWSVKKCVIVESFFIILPLFGPESSQFSHTGSLYTRKSGILDYSSRPCFSMYPLITVIMDRGKFVLAGDRANGPPLILRLQATHSSFLLNPSRIHRTKSCNTAKSCLRSRQYFSSFALLLLIVYVLQYGITNIHGTITDK